MPVNPYWKITIVLIISIYIFFVQPLYNFQSIILLKFVIKIKNVNLNRISTEFGIFRRSFQGHQHRPWTWLQIWPLYRHWSQKSCWGPVRFSQEVSRKSLLIEPELWTGSNIGKKNQLIICLRLSSEHI